MNKTVAFLAVTLIVLLIGSASSIINPYANAQNPTNTDENIIKGGITSIQDDDPNDNTDWITGGAYRMENINSESPMFNASFYMVKTDGTAQHTHDIYNFVLAGQPVSNGNSTIYNGTSTVTMRDGPVTDVPTSISLMEDSAISISVDPSKINNHFGNSPIYGTQNLICVERSQLCE